MQTFLFSSKLIRNNSLNKVRHDTHIQLFVHALTSIPEETQETSLIESDVFLISG